MTDIKSMTLTELKELMTELGEKPFRAKQIYSWLHEHLAASWEEMTNLPKSLKQKLEAYPITALETVDVQISKTDGTRKYLFRLSDGNMIESVLMKYKYGNQKFWARGYFVDTVGKNEKTVREYIQNQLAEDKLSDQMSMEEFIDPFTGEPVEGDKKKKKSKRPFEGQ